MNTLEKAISYGMSWNGITVSISDSNNTKWSPTVNGKFSEGNYGTSNGTYTRAVSGLYDSPQDPKPSGYYTEETVTQSVPVTEYRKLKLVYQ